MDTPTARGEGNLTVHGESQPLEALIAAALHEFRNTLAAIRAQAQMGLASNSIADVRQSLTKVIRQVDSSAESLRSGMALLPHNGVTPCSVSELIMESVNDLSALAAERGVSLERREDGPGEDLVAAYTHQLRIAIGNLLINAIQASSPGSKVLVQSQLASDCVTISVRDWGTGIPKDVAPLVFRPFFTAKVDGMGLGLFTVNYVVTELHKGSVWFESTEGQGTTFYLQIPRRTDAIG